MKPRWLNSAVWTALRNSTAMLRTLARLSDAAERALGSLPEPDRHTDDDQQHGEPCAKQPDGRTNNEAAGQGHGCQKTSALIA